MELFLRIEDSNSVDVAACRHVSQRTRRNYVDVSTEKLDQSFWTANLVDRTYQGLDLHGLWQRLSLYALARDPSRFQSFNT